MRLGTILAVLLTVVGLAAVVTAFLTNASPYVTAKQARVSKGQNLHVAGDLVPGSLAVAPESRIVSFRIKDQEGETLDVLYHGAPPANMGSATKIVAIGGMKGGKFHSEKLLLKCPSKYESTK